jgi:hypothetical protein
MHDTGGIIVRVLYQMVGCQSEVDEPLLDSTSSKSSYSEDGLLKISDIEYASQQSSPFGSSKYRNTGSPAV